MGDNQFWVTVSVMPGRRRRTADSASPSSRHCTIRDIARLAEVSVATASLVINGKPGVSEELSRRVRQAMDILDYHPHGMARSLKVGHSHLIGMVVDDVTNQFFCEVMGGAHEEARPHGYSLLLLDSRRDAGEEDRHLRTLLSYRVDGIILACSDSETSYDRLLKRPVPVVFIDRRPQLSRGLPFRLVTTDNIQAAQAVTRHLIALGHRRIGIVTGDPRLSTSWEREDGYRLALQEAGLPLVPRYLQTGSSDPDGAYRSTCDLLDLDLPPTAIFSCNNKMTLGIMRAIGERNLACPEQISVAAFDDFEWAATFRPRLTSVAQPSAEIGRQAMRLLLDALALPRDAELPATATEVVIPSTLHLRESSGPVNSAGSVPWPPAASVQPR